MIPFGLLIPLMKKIIYLSATGGWKNLDDEEVAAYAVVDEVMFFKCDLISDVLISGTRG